MHSEIGTGETPENLIPVHIMGKRYMVPPSLTIMKAMEYEHTHPDHKDVKVSFRSSNGVTTTSAVEWEAALAPRLDRTYPDRFAPGDTRCRTLCSLDALLPAEGSVQLGGDQLLARELLESIGDQDHVMTLDEFKQHMREAAPPVRGAFPDGGSVDGHPARRRPRRRLLPRRQVAARGAPQAPASGATRAATRATEAALGSAAWAQ